MSSPEYQRIVDELLERVDASRVTIRLDSPGKVFPIVAEACAPGIGTLQNATEIDLRAAATFKYLDTQQEHLVQSDCATGDYPAPPALIALYGVKAQMLGPIVHDGKLVGILSVHYAPSQRDWSEADVAALDEATERVTRLVEAS